MIRPCPLCDSLRKELLYIQKFTGNYSHRVSCCLNCGFIFVSNTPGHDYYSKYYKNSSKYEGTRKHEPHEKITNKIILKFIKKNLLKNANILDVGCATGSTLNYIKKTGFNNINGFDPAPLCKKIILKKYGIKISTSDILNFKTKKTFDFIILSQIIEHLVDLKKNIEKINSILSNDGYIFIGVPNMENHTLKFGEPFMEFSTEHINFFSFDHLSNLMSGYSCVLKKKDDLVIITIWKRNRSFKEAVNKYIKNSIGEVKHIERRISNIKEKVLVWGAGSFSQRLLKTTSLKSKILKFIDANENLIGKKLSGIEIISPKSLRNYNNPVLILTYRYKNEIVYYLKKGKYSNPVITI